MKYLLDANTLVEAKNRYYHMAICPAFWQWILLKSETRDIGSITLVAEELLRGNDELKTWVAGHKHIFIPVDDVPTQAAFAAVAAHIAGASALMKPGAMEDFLAGADPWLIAKAIATGATVVTLEAHHPEAKRKFLIPNVCRFFGVSYIDTFQLLHTLNAEFILA